MLSAGWYELTCIIKLLPLTYKPSTFQIHSTAFILSLYISLIFCALSLHSLVPSRNNFASLVWATSAYMRCALLVIRKLAIACQEGGAPLIKFLLACAIPLADERDALLSTHSVLDWHFQDVLRLPTREREEWKKACHEELESLRAQHVFELTDLPKGRKVIKNRWVFDIKQDGRKKAILVAKGFSQVKGIYFNEIFSPVVHFKTVRLMLALSLLEDWHIEALDVKTAFLLYMASWTKKSTCISLKALS